MTAIESVIQFMLEVHTQKLIMEWFLRYFTRFIATKNKKKENNMWKLENHSRSQFLITCYACVWVAERDYKYLLSLALHA